MVLTIALMFAALSAGLAAGFCAACYGFKRKWLEIKDAKVS